MTEFVRRFLGALRGSGAIFGEVAARPDALGQGFVVVVLAGVARGVAAFPDDRWLGLAAGTAVGILFWLIASVLVWAIGVHWMGHASGFPELLRTLAFAAAPLAALCVGAWLDGPVGRAFSSAVHLWATLVFVVAVREALHVSTRRALVVCVGALAAALALSIGSAAFLYDNVFLD